MMYCFHAERVVMLSTRFGWMPDAAACWSLRDSETQSKPVNIIALKYLYNYNRIIR